MPALVFNSHGRRRRVVSDNHPGLSHAPLNIQKAEAPLPLHPGWIAGELHCHTSYGCDQVEFGAPLEAIKRTSGAMGLQFAALTDHSYNLDDLPDDYLTNDPELTKWKLLKEEAFRLNRDGGVQLLPGEELSCRSSQGRNAHLLVIGNDEFLPGSGDSAEKWLHNRSELSVAEALSRISPDAFAAAAHPLTHPPLLERLLVHRGEWRAEDLTNPHLDGWQIVNGGWGNDFARGRSLLNDQLRKGRFIRIFGGDDAHGNFNRFRQVGLPMIRLRENGGNIFGRFTTRLKTDAHTAHSIITALKNAPVQVSDGPSLDYEIDLKAGMATIRWLSTAEFGTVSQVRTNIWWNGREESSTISPSQKSLYAGEISQKVSSSGFISAELIASSEDGRRSRSLLGPITLGQALNPTSRSPL